MSLFQALVILQFNNGSSFAYQQLKELTNIEDSELTRTVQSLSLGKKDSRILKKDPLVNTFGLKRIFYRSPRLFEVVMRSVLRLGMIFKSFWTFKTLHRSFFLS